MPLQVRVLPFGARSDSLAIPARSIPAGTRNALAARRTALQIRRPDLQPALRGVGGDPRLLPATDRAFTGRSTVPALRTGARSPPCGAARAAGALPCRHAAARDRYPDVQCRGADADLAAPEERSSRGQSA